MESCKIIEYLWTEFPLKAQVATGLVGNILGFLYTMKHVSNCPYFSLLFSYAFSLVLYLIYLYVKEVIVSSNLDILIFFLAIHARTLRSISSYGDIIRRSPKKKGIKRSPKTHLLIHPGISSRNIPFERILEEFIYRIIVISCIFSFIFNRSAGFWKTSVVLGGGLCFFFIRELEYLLTEQDPPGYLTEEMYVHYADLIRMILFLRI